MTEIAPFAGLLDFQYATGRNLKAVSSQSASGLPGYLHELKKKKILATTAHRLVLLPYHTSNSTHNTIKGVNSVKMSDQPKALKSRRLHSTARKQHLSTQKPEPQSGDNDTGPSQLAIETSAFDDGLGDTNMDDDDDIHSGSPRDPEILPDVPIHGIEGGDDIRDTDFDHDDLAPQSDTDSDNEEGESSRRFTDNNANH